MLSSFITIKCSKCFRHLSRYYSTVLPVSHMVSGNRFPALEFVTIASRIDATSAARDWFQVARLLVRFLLVQYRQRFKPSLKTRICHDLIRVGSPLKQLYL